MIRILFTTYNRLEYTKKALPALVESDDCEVIVIDNNSTDGTKEWLKTQPVKVIYNTENVGVRGAMNQFFEITKDDEYVGKVDNDTVVPKDWIKKLKEVITRHNLDIVQAKHHIIAATCAGGWDEFVKKMEKLGDGVYQHSFVGGSGILIRRSIIKEKLPQTKWVLGGWQDWQLQHPEFKKAFCENVQIKLLDDHGYGDYPEYYKKTLRLVSNNSGIKAIGSLYRTRVKKYIPRFIFLYAINPIIDVMRHSYKRKNNPQMPESVSNKKFPESQLAHKYLDGLYGLEIGGSAHNSFGLNTKNVDYTSDTNTIFKKDEVRLCGELMPIDIVAPGDEIPVPNESQDFIISSHVLEHFPDPIKALKEWYRIIKPGGYIFMIIPHKERTFDKDRERTKLDELIKRNNSNFSPKFDSHNHYSVWVTQDIVELIKYLGWDIIEVQDVDDKVGNGFTVVIKK